MLLDFSAVKDGRSTQTFSVESGDRILEGFFAPLARPLEVTGRVREQPHRSFLVELRVDGELEMGCRRCLVPVRQEIHERTHLLAQVADAPGTARAEEEGDTEVLPLRSPFDRVDIGPAVREVLFLAGERFPLCRPDCRGLCPECGEDLNATDCGCARRATDPRWRPLENLRS
ncbi:MAG: DUF177 domain-containing protein [Gemmatimonadota bacterium]